MTTRDFFLYLDFDGTLHSAAPEKADYFLWLPILVAMLEPHPEVKIIVSSDWRLRCSDAQLVHFLGSLGDRFAGITLTTGSDRAAEIRADVQARRAKRWLAIDDHITVRAAERRNRRYIWCPPDRGVSDATVQARVQELLKE